MAGACIRAMKVYSSWLLVLAMTVATHRANGDGVADLIAKAEQGEAVAQLELGGIYLKGEGVTKDVAEAVKWLSKASALGNSEAQMKLGGIYISGRGVLKNSVEAAKWYLMSAEQGNAAAQCQIGRMHLTGVGVPKDDVEAYKWSNLAATQGDAAAKKVIAFLLIRMTSKQIAEGKQRSEDFIDAKKAGKSLGLPDEAPPLPEEPLPLFAPE